MFLVSNERRENEVYSLIKGSGSHLQSQNVRLDKKNNSM